MNTMPRKPFILAALIVAATVGVNQVAAQFTPPSSAPPAGSPTVIHDIDIAGTPQGASINITGNIQAGGIFYGDGSGLTNLNISGGTGDGSGFTNLNASNIASGTLNDARLSTNVALKDGNNVWTGTNDFSALTVGGTNACLQDGTNCPALGGSATLQQVTDNGKITTNTVSVGGAASSATIGLNSNGSSYGLYGTGTAGGSIGVRGTGDAYGGWFDAGSSGFGVYSTGVIQSGYNNYNTFRAVNNDSTGAGLMLQTTAAGGRSYSILSTGPGAGIGSGQLGIFDGTAGAYRLAINAAGNTTVYGDLTVTGSCTGCGGNSGWQDDGTVVRLTTLTDNVGIGTATPATKFAVRDSFISGEMRFSSNLIGAAGGMNLDMHFDNGNGDKQASRIRTSVPNGSPTPSSTVEFSTVINGAFAERMRIHDNGNVGIGDATPAHLLTVGNGDLFNVTAGGSVGIGTSAVSGKLHILDTQAGYNAQLRVGASSATYGGMNLDTYFVSGGPEYHASRIRTEIPEGGPSGAEKATLSFQTRINGSLLERMRIHSNGYIGINTPAPPARLTVTDDVPGFNSQLRYYTAFDTFIGGANIDLLFDNNVGGGLQTGARIRLGVPNGTFGVWDADLQFHTMLDGTLAERMRIDAFGNVGIGTIAPAAKLQVNPSSGTEGVRIVSSDFSPLVVRNAANTADLFRVDQNGNAVVANLASEPASPSNGSVYYDTSLGKFRCYENGTWTDCVGSGGGAGTATLQFTRATVASSASDATKDAACQSEFGPNYRTANLLEAGSNWKTVSQMNSFLGDKQFNVAGITANTCLITAANPGQSTIACTGFSASRPVICVATGASLRFTRTHVHTTAVNATRDAACVAEFGTNYRGASIYDVNANWQSIVRVFFSGFVPPQANWTSVGETTEYCQSDASEGRVSLYCSGELNGSTHSGNLPQACVYVP